SLIAADRVDRIAWFRATAVIGGDGVAAIAGLGLDKVADAPRFERVSVTAVGEDVLETYARQE
ncbi:MAG: riboflavin biosynthesis protein RibD, partial [Alphaproteobacteria bacterium]|nr:riboflavin biosynthesis protein RibD [Alphaproteobacteria bacterium]